MLPECSLPIETFVADTAVIWEGFFVSFLVSPHGALVRVHFIAVLALKWLLSYKLLRKNSKHSYIRFTLVILNFRSKKKLHFTLKPLYDFFHRWRKYQCLIWARPDTSTKPVGGHEIYNFWRVFQVWLKQITHFLQYLNICLCEVMKRYFFESHMWVTYY